VRPPRRTPEGGAAQSVTDSQRRVEGVGAVGFERGRLSKGYLLVGLLGSGLYFLLPKGGITQASIFIAFGTMQLIAIASGIAIARPFPALVPVGVMLWEVCGFRGGRK
jgi:hypothetical protein